jgi:uncharacterized protein (DUF3084 family)
MEPTLTAEQKKQLASWVVQRDSILVDIGAKKTENEKLTATNLDFAASNTEISNKIQQSIGRLAELDRVEDARAKLMTCENADLTIQKSTLQAEVSALQSEVASLTATKIGLNADIASVIKIHEAVFTRANDIERIITETVNLSASNAREVKNILTEAGDELKKVIDIGKENVEVTNRAIQQIPQMIVDIHKDVIERKKAARAKLPQ